MKDKQILVLISGNGSNLQAFIDAQESGTLSGTICAVISNKANVFGLERAELADIPTFTLEHANYSNRELFDRALAETIDQFQPDLIILAGFMRILTAEFVQKFHGKLLNIHPSLLPNYPGLHTHQRAIENGDAFHGTSVHFVTEELDGGPVIAQAKTAIDANETVESLNAKIQKLEHQLYPWAAQLLITGKITLQKDNIYFEDKPLEKTLLF